MELFFERGDNDQVAMQVFECMQLFPGAMDEYGITGLQWTICQLPVESSTGLMNGQWGESEGFTKTDLFNGLPNEA